MMERGKILIVDDDLMMLGMLSQMLESEGYKVDTACDSNIAIRYAQHNDYDVVLTDMYMPYKTGLDFIKELRNASENKKTRFIMMSGGIPEYGGLDSHILESMKGYNFDIFLSKPLSMDKLFFSLEKEIQKGRAAA